jgi:hypothetical protein
MQWMREHDDFGAAGSKVRADDEFAHGVREVPYASLREMRGEAVPRPCPKNAYATGLSTLVYFP